jgi:DNA-binding XRE family transcriptional regulator
VAGGKIPSGRMIRAGRALLGLEQLDLAQEIAVDRRTISRLEADTEIPVNPLKIATYRKMRDALEKRGVVFLYGGRAHGEGVARASRSDSGPSLAISVSNHFTSKTCLTRTTCLGSAAGAARCGPPLEAALARA